MRPGVEDAMAEQIEESLENLDNLLTNIKSGNMGQKEEEIMKIGKKYNIDFDLNQDET